jgi:hypothetical protein
VIDFKTYFICGRKFQLIADIVIDTDRRDNLKTMKNKSIIWCKTDFVRDLFNEIKNDKNDYFLITHNSDYSITEDVFQLRPKCIKKWFAQNVDYKHSDLVPLPIGLENDIGPSKGAYTDYDVIGQSVLNSRQRIIDKVYCNFNVLNCNKRNKVIDSLCRNDIAVLSSRLNYSDYCSALSKYKYIASPRGNGIDCHRTWEALYIGCVPMVESHLMYNAYSLPIIQVDDWAKINIDFLREAEKSDMSKKTNYKQLDINYWFELIMKEKRAV